MRIVEMPILVDMVMKGHLIVAGGGGGIPVIEIENGEMHGVEAVIDKDFTSAMIAAEVGADTLSLVTAVEHVCINFGKPNQEALRNVNIARLNELIAEKQFPEGSMLPKIRAAIDFVERSERPDARASSPASLTCPPPSPAKQARRLRASYWKKRVRHEVDLLNRERTRCLACDPRMPG